MVARKTAPRMTRWIATLVVAASAAGAAGWWAGKQVVAPAMATTTTRTDAFVLTTVIRSTVGRSLPLSVAVSQPVRPVARNTLSGVVTALSPGERRNGDVVYSVAQVPVRVVAGVTPFYRDLGVGARGKDVMQLQGALVSKGLLDEANGYYGTGTVDAVKRWQKTLGQEQTGTVPLGQVVAVSSLPTQVSLAEAISLGGVLGGGEESVLAPTGERRFELEVSDEQSKLIPEGSTVNVHFNKLTWSASITASRVDVNTNNTIFSLSASGGGPVCANSCSQLPATAKTHLRSEVIVVPSVAGASVPVAAVQTKADGSAFVLDARGSEHRVTVQGSASGIAIVAGVAVGTRIRVPASASATG